MLAGAECGHGNAGVLVGRQADIDRLDSRIGQRGLPRPVLVDAGEVHSLAGATNVALYGCKIAAQFALIGTHHRRDARSLNLRPGFQMSTAHEPEPENGNSHAVTLRATINVVSSDCGAPLVYSAMAWFT